MSNDTGIFSGLTTEMLMRLVIIIETSCFLFGALAYLKFSGLFYVYLPIILVFHLMTLLALPSVFKKLKGDPNEKVLHSSAVSEEDETLYEIDLWDRASVGFYVFANVGALLFLTVVLYF